MKDDFREPPWMCSRCGYVMDAAGLVFDNGNSKTTPVDGDLSLCMNYAQPLMRQGAAWRAMTDAEFAALHPENRKQLALGMLAIDRVIDRDLSKRGGRA